MNTHLSMLAVDIHAVSRNKGIVGTVKNIEETLMERQSGT
jgi:hypothetical protein